VLAGHPLSTRSCPGQWWGASAAYHLTVLRCSAAMGTHTGSLAVLIASWSSLRGRDHELGLPWPLAAPDDRAIGLTAGSTSLC